MNGWPRSHCLVRLALALTLSGTALAGGGPDSFPTFKRKLLKASLETQNSEITGAVRTLCRHEDFLRRLHKLASHGGGQSGSNDAVLRRLEASAHAWAKEFPYKAPYVFDSFKLLTNDWCPGKNSALLGARVWTINANRNVRVLWWLDVQLNPCTFQVTGYSFRYEG